MLVVGLTGGIGSGKTTVAQAFARLDVPLIDTDVIARELVAPGLPALKAIVSHFGNSVLTRDGELDRPKLREIVFSSAEQRAELERILHPRIREVVQSRLAELDAPYCLIIIPLLSETGGYPFLDRVLLVDAAEETQIARTMARDGLERQQVEQILASQSSREQRRAIADDIIDNNGDSASIQQQVEALHQHYLRLAESRAD
ncbi:MAG: dephospho-CoA kinase [Thiohalophilus sp.]|jgi:dephospho-CoA kinase